MKKLTTLLVTIFLVSSVRATNYYFSSSSGDDNRTTTQAQSSSTPWKTLTKLNSFFSSLQPGDSVLFKRGDTFYGSISINKSGTTAAPIVMGAYGSGNKPVITGFKTLTNWVSVGNGIYECYESALGANLNMVVINGTQQAMGRYPNSNTTNKGYLTFESHSNNSSITDNQLLASPNFTGAEVVIRKERWIIDRHPITNHSGGTLTYDATNSSGSYPQNNWGYFIQNHIATLDQIGEWYYNPSTKKLSVYFGSNAPSSFVVQASAVNYLIAHNWGVSNITFDNLAFTGANANALRLYGGNHFKINTCDARFSGVDGVFVADISYLDIMNSTVTDANYTGVRVDWGANSYITIRNNKIDNTCLFPGMVERPDYGGGTGITCFASNSVVENNQVTNSGFIGIRYSKDYVTIKNNIVKNFNFTKDDGGGIYTSGSPNLVNYGRKVIGNIVSNGIGAKEGTYNQWDANYTPADGIYLDENANGVEVSGNTIFNMNNGGIMVHKSHHNTIKNNVSYNNKKQFIMQDDVSGQMRANVITNNTFFAQNTTQLTSAVISGANDISLFGRFDSNYYCRPISAPTEDAVINHVYGSPSTNEKISLATWKTRYSQIDATSKKTFVGVSDTSNILFEYNTTTATKSLALSGSYVGVDGKPYSGSVQLAPFSSIILIKSATSTTSTTYYKDADGDGFGNTASSITATSQQAGYVTKNGDCNDNDNSVYPNAPELCDGKDNNCNGQVDENCSSPAPSTTTPSISINNYTVYESAGVATLTVKLSNSSTQAVSVTFATVNGTATSKKDYKYYKSTLTIPAGSLTGTINISIVKDYTTESTEYFDVQLSSPVNATLYNNYGRITIMDGAPATLAAIEPTSMAEAGDNNLSEDESSSAVKLTLEAFPNPSPSYFTINAKSLNKQKLDVTVMDVSGRIIERRTGISANSSFQLGHNFKPGMYIIEALQNKVKTQYKIIKSSN